MPFVLTGTILGRPVRVVLPPGRLTLGSASDNDVRLVDPTVSRRHAELDIGADGVGVRDLGSSNGTAVDGSPASGRAATRATAGAVLRFGSVELALEQVAQDDLEAGVRLAAPIRVDAPPDDRVETGPLRSAPRPTTLDLRPLDSLLLERLPPLLEAAASGCGAATVAARAGEALFDELPVRWLEIAWRSGGVLFTAGERPGEGADSGPAGVIRTAGDLEARALGTVPDATHALAGALDLLLQLVDVGRTRAPRPAAPARRPEAPPVPDPPSLHREVREIYRRATRIAAGAVSVLVRGESGTGKELLARYIHRASGRPDDRFVALNCAALPSDLLEAELFGVEKGAATGVDARPGKFEIAHEGTLFLDEIGDMSPATQARVLRVIQEGSCHRIGGTSPRPARPRIVSATNRPLRELLDRGEFRADLYHRINGWEVELPPLRFRRADVPNLAVHFLAEEARALGVRPAGISRRALRCLESYPWPGNVRQLRQEIARAALFLEDGDLLDTRLLSDQVTAGAGGLDGAPEAAGAGRGSLKDRLARHERAEIEAALRAADGDVAAAAEALEVHRSTLYRRMKAVGLTDD